MFGIARAQPGQCASAEGIVCLVCRPWRAGLGIVKFIKFIMVLLNLLHLPRHQSCSAGARSAGSWATYKRPGRLRRRPVAAPFFLSSGRGGLQCSACSGSALCEELTSLHRVSMPLLSHETCQKWMTAHLKLGSWCLEWLYEALALAGRGSALRAQGRLAEADLGRGGDSGRRRRPWEALLLEVVLLWWLQGGLAVSPRVFKGPRSIKIPTSWRKRRQQCTDAGAC